MKITVIAAGSWGTALAMVLDENGHEVAVWARNEIQINTIKQTRMNAKYLPGIEIPASIDFTSDLAESVEDSDRKSVV